MVPHLGTRHCTRVQYRELPCALRVAMVGVTSVSCGYPVEPNVIYLGDGFEVKLENSLASEEWNSAHLDSNSAHLDNSAVKCDCTLLSEPHTSVLKEVFVINILP